MKLLTVIFLFALGSVFFALDTFGSLGTLINGNVRLHWSYDAESANTNLAFNVYSTTDLLSPADHWTLITNLLSTAALDTNDVSGTNYLVNLPLTPGQYFFVATATNFWGESSVTSNVVSTPPVPQPVTTLKIQKLP